jgi:hypothetical protein
MAETLGMLCDKLTIIKLKQYHSEDVARLELLEKQAAQMMQEIDEYVENAIAGNIPADRLRFNSNKVYKKEGNDIKSITGSIGHVFYTLADINCKLWHEQEKVYEFDKVPVEEKDHVVKQLAVLNLERNQCIDEIDRQFSTLVKNNNAHS